MNSLEKKYKIAIIAPVPFYYHVPLYQKLAQSSEIDLMVYYCSDETLRGVDVQKTYNTNGCFTDKDDLLNGYKYKFLKNYSLRPSHLHWPDGLINFGIFKEIKNGKYDAVILQSWTNLTWWMAFLTALIYKTPVLFMTDSNISSEASKSKIKRFIKKNMLGRFLFHYALGFLTSGTANEDFYKYYYVSEKKMVRLYFSWGYDKLLKKSEELSIKREELREKFGIKKDDFVFLYVGRLSDEKLLLILLEAYNRVKSKNKKLFLVGDGPMKKEIKNQVKKLGVENVFFAGFQSREKIPDFYAAADAFVLPSRAETWGIVVNEAMCFGLPVLVSNKVGAGVDMVKNNYNGFIFESGNADDLFLNIDKLMNLSNDERLLFSKRSKEMLIEWLYAIDPVKQLIKILELSKYKNEQKRNF